MALRKDIELNKDKFAKLKSAFLHSPIASRIVCLLIHGSSLYYKISIEDNKRDIDLELVLDTPEKDDYITIKKILDSVGIKTECQLRYLREIVSCNSLIHITFYKVFMFFAYSNAYCLIGNNIYKELVQKISENEVRKSLLISAQISFKDVRKSFFAGNSNYIINKNIIRMLVCICMYENILNYKEIGKAIFFNQETKGFVGIITKKYIKYLSPSEVRGLKNFAKHDKENELLPQIFPIIEKIMEIFSKRIMIKRS